MFSMDSGDEAVWKKTPFGRTTSPVHSYGLVNGKVWGGEGRSHGKLLCFWLMGSSTNETGLQGICGVKA